MRLCLGPICRDLTPLQGKRLYCAPCRLEMKRGWARAWRRRHPEQQRAISARWREANREHHRALALAWYYRNRERDIARRTEYRRTPKALTRSGNRGDANANHPSH